MDAKGQRAPNKLKRDLAAGVAAHLDPDLVTEVDRDEDALDQVVAVVAPPQDAQAQVDLRGCLEPNPAPARSRRARAFTHGRAVTSGRARRT